MANNQGRIPDWVPFIGTQDKWDYWTGGGEDSSGEQSGVGQPMLGVGQPGDNVDAGVSEGPGGEGNMLTKAYNTAKDKLISTYKGMDDFDSANFNVQDPEQVLQLQKRLGLKEDGIFGPKTEAAYRGLVNQQRADQGQDAYIYPEDSMASMAVESEEPSWADRRAQNKQDRYNRRLNRARDRHAEGKRVWNKGFRNIVNEEDATQSSIR